MIALVYQVARNMAMTAVTLIVLCPVGQCAAAAEAESAALVEARESIRIEQEKAYAADPALRIMQSWIEEAGRMAREEEYSELRRRTTQYIDAHLKDDALMSGYYALRSACRKIADEKMVRRILADDQLRESWTEIWRAALVKTDPALEKASPAKIAELILGQIQSEAGGDDAQMGRIEKILQSHALPEFVVQYVVRWAEFETQIGAGQLYLAARTPQELESARSRLGRIERGESLRPGQASTATRQIDHGVIADRPSAWMGGLADETGGDSPPDLGPEIVILRELEETYEPVPFDHKSHAEMAQMWEGCVTCHHRSPQPSTKPGDSAAAFPVVKTQEASTEFPACKSCHSISAVDSDIGMPSLKGAYHRQCLNCHKEWMHENACVICHEPKENAAGGGAVPSPDDIVGRMHPPIPEPDVINYRTRFTPVAGGNVLFRHQAHTVTFGIKCAHCHSRDNCANCHGPVEETNRPKPLQPGWTWAESHGPCMSCHQQNRCQHCHYRDGEEPPGPFAHIMTGQDLDKDHADLACVKCHANLRLSYQPTCGDAACHPRGKVEFPLKRPGPIVTSETLLALMARSE